MTLDQRILNLLKKYMGKLFQKKVLTSMEEVEANTNETNLVAAPVVAELNNKLGEQPEWITDPVTGKITGYKMGGADTVHPFSSIDYPDTVTLFYGNGYWDNAGEYFQFDFFVNPDIYHYITVNLKASDINDTLFTINGKDYYQGKWNISLQKRNVLKVSNRHSGSSAYHGYVYLSKT